MQADNSLRKYNSNIFFARSLNTSDGVRVRLEYKEKEHSLNYEVESLRTSFDTNANKYLATCRGPRYAVHSHLFSRIKNMDFTEQEHVRCCWSVLKEHYKLFIGTEISATYPDVHFFRAARFIGTRKSTICRACTNHHARYQPTHFLSEFRQHVTPSLMIHGAILSLVSFSIGELLNTRILRRFFCEEKKFCGVEASLEIKSFNRQAAAGIFERTSREERPAGYHIL